MKRSRRTRAAPVASSTAKPADWVSFPNSSTRPAWARMWLRRASVRRRNSDPGPAPGEDVAARDVSAATASRNEDAAEKLCRIFAPHRLLDGIRPLCQHVVVADMLSHDPGCRAAP